VVRGLENEQAQAAGGEGAPVKWCCETLSGLLATLLPLAEFPTHHDYHTSPSEMSGHGANATRAHTPSGLLVDTNNSSFSVQFSGP
jgi:hypothetical protein